jgi:hypothetical protein
MMDNYNEFKSNMEAALACDAAERGATKAIAAE